MKRSQRVAKAWQRVFIVLALAWVPITGLAGAVGLVDLFGRTGFQFLLSGVILFLVLIPFAPWVTQAFGVLEPPSDEDSRN
ncbi:MAG: hypothetical protein QGF38_08695 [Rhodospirillales bacterium]|jgi:hypothetical protein|nr:hypothetical protein [Rhodospirillales bacterium]|tara:strand:+ start:37 stop:279 length:243 start_codon:yes stop_codon:yes gene_type:complete